MPAVDLLADVVDGRLHAAVIRKTTLVDLYVDPAVRSPASYGDIHLGRVKKTDTRLNAAIVDIGDGIEAILPAKYAWLPDMSKPRDRAGIGDILRNGQTVIVQVRAEAKHGSLHDKHKMPRLTMMPVLQGRCASHAPLAQRINIHDGADVKAVTALAKTLKGKGGWLFSAVAGRAPAEHLAAECAALQDDWLKIQSVLQTDGATPRLLHSGPDAVARALGDYGVQAFDHIYAGDKNILQNVIHWGERHAPGLGQSKRLRLFRPEVLGQKLFDLYDVYAEIESLFDSVVHLPCGGSIIIEPTHAVTMVDVNQGAAENIFTVNLEAMQALARHIRLRNLGGAILVDFIGMSLRPDRLRIVEAAEKLITRDFVNNPPQVHGFTRLGIVEITRKRKTATLAEKYAAAAPKQS